MTGFSKLYAKNNNMHVTSRDCVLVVCLCDAILHVYSCCSIHVGMSTFNTEPTVKDVHPCKLVSSTVKDVHPCKLVSSRYAEKEKKKT